MAVMSSERRRTPKPRVRATSYVTMRNGRPMPVRMWSEADLQELRQLTAQGLRTDAIGARIGRSKESVWAAQDRYGIHYNREALPTYTRTVHGKTVTAPIAVKWTAAERAFVERHTIMGWGAARIAAQMPGRTAQAVAKQRWLLGLTGYVPAGRPRKGMGRCTSISSVIDLEDTGEL